jgi:hypothetical protein
MFSKVRVSYVLFALAITATSVGIYAQRPS